MDMLIDAGINFERLALEGIDHSIFSRQVLNHSLFQPECTWIGFHTDHDMSYLLNLLTGKPLPESGLQEFTDELSRFISTFYDLKVISDHCAEFQRGSLNRLAEQLGVTRDSGT